MLLKIFAGIVASIHLIYIFLILSGITTYVYYVFRRLVNQASKRTIIFMNLSFSLMLCIFPANLICGDCPLTMLENYLRNADKVSVAIKEPFISRISIYLFDIQISSVSLSTIDFLLMVMAIIYFVNLFKNKRVFA